MPVKHTHRKEFVMLAKNPIYKLKQVTTHGSWYDYEDSDGVPVRLRSANAEAYHNGHYGRFMLNHEVHDRLVACGGSYFFVAYRMNKYGNMFVTDHTLRKASEFLCGAGKVTKIHRDNVFVKP